MLRITLRYNYNRLLKAIIQLPTAFNPQLITQHVPIYPPQWPPHCLPTSFSFPIYSFTVGAIHDQQPVRAHDTRVGARNRVVRGISPRRFWRATTTSAPTVLHNCAMIYRAGRVIVVYPANARPTTNPVRPAKRQKHCKIFVNKVLPMLITVKSAITRWRY